MTTPGQTLPEQQTEIEKSVYIIHGATREMSRQEFQEGDEVNQHVLEGGSHILKRMVIVQVGKRRGGSTFLYQTKPKDGGDNAKSYTDGKGNDWFEEDDLVRAPKE